ncbi:uncharacterized protein PRCAT00005665001 [Priceomyces carsonii]|uniref:uncharacterized protein n=1 Tax=Priceomyces carsonii TaxID=28549 RepID=UPI002ED80782|nr:unnamed protein product [Priceomyces carsonii]
MFEFSDLPTHMPISSSLDGSLQAKLADHDEREEHKELRIEQNIVEEKSEEVEQKSHLEINRVPNETLYIPGTSISLQTEEDIAKWIEERKRRWPTRKNIEQKEKMKREQEIQTPNYSKRHNIESPLPENQKKQKSVCKYFQQHRTCRFGKRCKNLHEFLSNSSELSTSSKGISINGIRTSIPQRFKNDVNDKSLFRKLVQRDQFENENSLILDFIQFLDSKGFINPENSR